MISLLKQFNQTATVSVLVSLIVIVIGLGVNITSAAGIWQDPTAPPPNLGSLEPPLNTSEYDQEKTGGLNVATLEGGLVVGNGVPGVNKLLVLGNTYFFGNALVDENLNVTGNMDASLTNAGSAEIISDLYVHNGLLWIDNSTDDSVYINSTVVNGLVTLWADNEPGIDAKNDSVNVAAVQGNNGTSGGTGIFGSGYNYGVSASSLDGYAVLADAISSGTGSLYARGSNNKYGVVGRGLYGVVGLDNTTIEDANNNPIFNNPGTKRAGLFAGSVDIKPSIGGNSDLIVDSDTFVVSSLTDKVGIGTNNPATKLQVTGEENISAIYALAGINTNWEEPTHFYDSVPTQTVAGIYGESDTVSYNGAGTGWNFGVFGKAGDPGNSRSVGIMGVDFIDGGDTYAGWFDGLVGIDGMLSVTSKLKTHTTPGILTANSSIYGAGNLNLAGDDSDINLTGTDGDIWLRDDINAGGGIEYRGKIYMDGGLPYLSTVSSTCNVQPGAYAEGTMFVCAWCPSAYQRYTAIMVRMNHVWTNIGYDVSNVTCGVPTPPSGREHIWPRDGGEG